MPDERTICMVSEDRDLIGIVGEIVRQFAEASPNPKTEFTGIEVRQVLLEEIHRNLKLPGGEPLLIIADSGCLAALFRGLDARPIPVLVVVDQYTARMVEEVYHHGYFFTRALFRKKSFQDPEERGLLARVIKEELRRSLALRKEPLPDKPLGWKIRADVADYTERRFVSLFLDPEMSGFMQQLLFIVERVGADALPSKPLSDEAVLDLFYSIGEALQKKEKDQKKSRRDELSKLKSRFSSYSRPPGAVCPPAILLEGETGTGKTLIAEWLTRQLHQAGRGELIRIPLVNVSEELLEAELFGTVHGAYTDSVSRPGQLLLAWGNTVFLDEIGDASPRLQAKLLVYLDRFTFSPMGWPYTDPLYSPTYVIAATNKDLRQEVESGRFREDLYHRFRYKPQVPPLRARKADLRILIDFVLQDPRINRPKGKNLGREVEQIGIAALEKLETYGFPGNFRELEDTLSRAVFHAIRQGRSIVQEEDIHFPIA